MQIQMTTMTYTELKAKPGEYVWDEDAIQFVGRINKDGTEDKRFKKGGLCSLLNTIIKETGYIPKSPQVFARRIADHKRTQYLVKGYGVVVKCYDLTAEMWLAKASEYLGIEGDGISDILKHISKSKAIEHKAKIESLALIFGKELKSKKLADLTEVSAFEQRLREQRRGLAAKERIDKKERELKEGMKKVADIISEWIVATNPKKIEEAMTLSVRYNELWVLRAIIMKFKRVPKDVAKQINKTVGRPLYKLLEANKMSMFYYLAKCACIKYDLDEYKEEAKEYQKEVEYFRHCVESNKHQTWQIEELSKYSK